MEDLIKGLRNGQWTLEKALDSELEARRERVRKRLQMLNAPVRGDDGQPAKPKAPAAPTPAQQDLADKKKQEEMRARSEAAAQKKSQEIANSSPEAKAARAQQIEQFMNQAPQAPSAPAPTPDKYAGMRPVDPRNLTTMNNRMRADPAKQYGEDQIKQMLAEQEKRAKQIETDKNKVVDRKVLRSDDDGLRAADPKGAKYGNVGEVQPGNKTIEALPPQMDGRFHNQGQVSRGQIVSRRVMYEDKETKEKKARWVPALEQHHWSWDANADNGKGGRGKWQHRGLTYTSPNDEGSQDAKIGLGQQIAAIDQRRKERAADEQDVAPAAPKPVAAPAPSAPAPAATPAAPAAPASTSTATQVPAEAPWRAAARVAGAKPKPVTYSAGGDDDEE